MVLSHDDVLHSQAEFHHVLLHIGHSKQSLGHIYSLPLHVYLCTTHVGHDDIKHQLVKRCAPLFVCLFMNSSGFRLY